MYGLIGKMTAAPGKQDELISILLEGIATMPGCLSYIVAKDASDPKCDLDYGSVGEPGESRGLAVAAIRQRGHRERQTAHRGLQRSRCHYASGRDGPDAARWLTMIQGSASLSRAA